MPLGTFYSLFFQTIIALPVQTAEREARGGQSDVHAQRISSSLIFDSLSAVRCRHHRRKHFDEIAAACEAAMNKCLTSTETIYHAHVWMLNEHN